MRKILSAVVVAGFVAALCGVAEAKDMTNMKGLGWFDSQAPIGGILWFSPKIGVTAGFGFSKEDDGQDATDEDTQINIAGGIPIVLAGGDDVNFMFRPSVLFKSKPNAATDSEFDLRADLAVEFFITSRASVLAGHGFEFQSFSPSDGNPNQETQTKFGTRAISVTEVGFYYYFMK